MTGRPVTRLGTKESAHARVSYAIKVGRLIRPEICDRCKLKPKRIRAHHHDYMEPYDVEWLCDSCHGKEHGPIYTARGVRADRSLSLV